MPQIVQDIRAETNDVLDLVVVTHAHQDHISGFGAHASDWASVTVNEVWMPWTEDPTDSQAISLRTKQLSLAKKLDEHLRFTGKRTEATDSILENFVGFNLSNAASMRVARGGFRGPQTVRYLEAGDRRTSAAQIPDLEVLVLSPSRDEQAITKMDPPAGQRWLHADGGPADPADRIELFVNAKVKRNALAKLGRDCVLDRAEEGELEAAVLADETLALTLDDVMNNTSLVLLLRYKGSALLFPGDAQWGNWSTWLEKTGADAVLNEVTFFKVGHHGSHNSTPRTIVPKFAHPEVAAMISTQGKPFPSIPKMNMVDALSAQCHKRIARSDWVDIANAPDPGGAKTVKKPFRRGPFWIDYLRQL